MSYCDHHSQWMCSVCGTPPDPQTDDRVLELLEQILAELQAIRQEHVLARRARGRQL